MKLRTAFPQDLQKIELAMQQLREARDLLSSAGAKKARDYVAAALKSAEGAWRHASRIVQKTEFGR